MTRDDGLPIEATLAGPDIIMTEQKADSDAPEGVSLDPVIQAHIGRELRALFDEIADEPVPDRFLALLQSLEAKKQDKS
jgi:hypothetical protein